MRDGLKELVKYFALIVGLSIAIVAVYGYLTTFKSKSDDQNSNFVDGLPTSYVVVSDKMVG